MKRGSLFFGLALILFAGLFFLKGLGVIADVMPLVWPLAIILFGLWLLMSGLFPGPGRGSVLRVDAEGRVARVEVETGIHDDGLIEIVSGLDAGDRVVSRAGAFVRPGDRINPVPADPLAAAD